MLNKIISVRLLNSMMMWVNQINFNFLLITHKILNGQSAGYLEPLIKEYYPSRALRSSSRSLLCPSHKNQNIWRTRVFPLQHLMEHYPIVKNPEVLY